MPIDGLDANPEAQAVALTGALALASIVLARMPADRAQAA